jgi:protein TonB
VTTVAPAPFESRAAFGRAPVAPRPRRRTVRVSALTVSVALHVAALAAGAWIESGATPGAATRESPRDARFEARVVAAPAPEPEIVRPAEPTADPLGTVPPSRAGDDAALATFLDEADDAPPPAAAPTIAVDGGPRGAPRPSEWAPLPRISAGGFAGLGHGGRREGGHGRGGSGAGGDGGSGVAGQAAAPEPVAPPPPPVRVAARVLEVVEPRYPDAARRRGLEGVVRIEVDLGADGAVVDVRVLESSGVTSFDDAAVRAVRRWRFAPETVDGAGVATTLALPPIRFRLE